MQHTKGGQNPLHNEPGQNIYSVILCYPGFVHPDWLAKFEQTIRALRTSVA